MVELISAPFIPLLFWLSINHKKWFFITTFALGLFSFLYGEKTRWGVGVYLVDFAIGVAAFRWGKSITDRLRGFIPLIALLSVATLAFGRLIGPWRFENNYHSPAATMIEALAAAMLITLVAFSPAHFSALKLWPLKKLGDISYSFYLVHLPVLAFIAGFAGDILEIAVFNGNPLFAAATLLSITLIVCLPFSYFSFKFIELPGKALAKHF